jgi:hypothetical protein
MLILSSYLHLDFPVVFSGFPTKSPYALLFSRICATYLILINLIILIIFVESASYEASHYTVLSSFLLFYYFWLLSACIQLLVPIMSEIKFNTCIL